MAMFTNTSREETFELPVVEGYDCEVNGNIDACIESFDDQLAVIEAMHALDIAEIEYGRKIQSLKESGAEDEEIEDAEEELEKVTEASIKDIFAKIKEVIKKIWAKIKAFFASVKKFFDALILSGKDFAKKYQKEIEGCKPFIYERFEYTIDMSDINPAEAAKDMVGEAESEMLKGIENATADEIKEAEDYYANIDDDELRAEFAGKSGKLTSAEYQKELYKACRNGKDYKEKLTTDPKTFVDWLLNKSANSAKNIANVGNEIDKIMSNLTSSINSIEGKVKSNANDPLASRRASICNKMVSTVSKINSFASQGVNAIKAAHKECDGVAKAICVRAIAEKKKQAKEGK